MTTTYEDYDTDSDAGTTAEYEDFDETNDSEQLDDDDDDARDSEEDTDDDDDGSEDDDSEDDTGKADTIDFEYEGEKLKLPKSFIEKVEKGILRQDDYTRKTQMVAQERRAVENSRVELERYEEAVRQSIATLSDMRIAQQQANDLAAYIQEIEAGRLPDEAGNLLSYRQRYYEVSNMVNELAGRIQKEAEKEKELNEIRAVRAAQEQPARLAMAISQADRALKKVIPNWTPKLRESVLEFSIRTYGFDPRAAFVAQSNPAIMRALFDARRADLQNKKSPAPAVSKTIRPKGSGGRVRSSDDLSTEEYIRQRDAHERKLRYG
jgi:hypothetical protein